jgi:hypothetical protein
MPVLSRVEGLIDESLSTSEFANHRKGEQE